jgi:hypothetical protein
LAKQIGEVKQRTLTKLQRRRVLAGRMGVLQMTLVAFKLDPDWGEFFSGLSEEMED